MIDWRITVVAALSGAAAAAVTIAVLALMGAFS